MIAAQLIAKCLQQEGVDTVFGLCGHTNLALLDALRYDTDIRFVSVRHEQVAAHAADAYFRVTHKPGVLLLHVGPGMANAVTGVATAALDSSAMVVLVGDIQSYHFGRDPHQEIRAVSDGSQHEIYRPFAKRVWQVRDADQIADTLAWAFNLATSGRPGPVVIDIPMDYLSLPTRRTPADLTGRRPTSRPGGDAADVARAVDMLLRAERPAIYAGGGVILAEAWAELTALGEHLRIPVATSLMGKGAIPEDNPLALGMTGVYGCPIANEACRDADVVLAVGTRFTEFDTNSWTPGYTFNIPPTRLIHVDIDPREIGKTYPVEVGIAGDARAVLTAMLELVRRATPGRTGASPWLQGLLQQRQAWQQDVAIHQASAAVPIRPERILAEVRKAMGPADIILTDTGWNKNGVGNQFPILQPMTHLPPGGFATMGFGPAGAIGAKAAHPNRNVVALVGDGAFSSTISAVFTAVENGLAPVWVVMNNYSYGVITGMQRRNFGRTAWTEFFRGDGQTPYNPDFAALARAAGAGGTRVTQPDDLGPALREALASGQPWVLDVIMDSSAPIPSKGYWDVNRILEEGAKVR